VSLYSVVFYFFFVVVKRYKVRADKIWPYAGKEQIPMQYIMLKGLHLGLLV